VEAALGLEPLAGEAGGGGRSGGGVDAAEGGVGGGPSFDSGGVGREDRAADVVRADEGDDAAFDDRDELPAVPDVFADQGAGGVSTVDRNRESKRISRLSASVRDLFR